MGIIKWEGNPYKWKTAGHLHGPETQQRDKNEQ
jgi:hypothetical protein